MYKDCRAQNQYNKVSIQYPVKLIIKGRVKQDMFLDWSEVMAGYHVDSRQLYVNNVIKISQSEAETERTTHHTVTMTREIGQPDKLRGWNHVVALMLVRSPSMKHRYTILHWVVQR